MLEYVSYKTDKPTKLVIFLHGYNNIIADYQYATDWMKEKIRDAVIILPQAPEISDKNPLKKQWFGMLKYDENNKRTQEETPSSEIFAIYNAAGNDVRRNAKIINEFIDEMQKKYNIGDESTYLIGFSQGAMLTIYTALSRSQSIAGAFVLSGLVAGSDLLEDDIHSCPPIYIFHGENDLKVQFKTLSVSIDWLKKHRINPHVYTYSDLGHKICEKEITEIAEIINPSDVI